MYKQEMEMLYCSLAFFTTIFLLYKIISSSKPNKNHPPGPPSLPILGHLHLIKTPFHRTFHSLAQQYGPIFSLRLGHQPVLVVSSPSAAEECFSQNDIVFANRPTSLLGQHLGYNHSILIWAPYGPHWRNLRRAATLTALSQKQIHLGGPARRAEIRATARELIRGSENGSREVNLTEMFVKLTVNLLMRVITGKTKETKIKTSQISVMTVCDFVPFLRWVGYKGMEKELKRIGKERDEELQSWIDEGRMSRKHGEHEKKTLIEELLDLQEMEPDYYTDEILKGMILVLLLAGSDTTSKTLEWTMSNLLNHPKILEKARSEIDAKVDKGRIVDDSDLPKLNYLRCIIYETLRLFPPAPLLVPHYSSQECTIGGYHVPKGTILFVNAWALHRDPNIWEEPTKFKPDRFEIEKEGFKYMPFGIGRRACPGNNFALQNVALVLATLIQCFDWSTIDSGLVDLTEQGGSILMPKERPLHAICHLRSSMDVILSQI